MDAKSARSAINSQYYVENSSQDWAANLDVDMASEIEETMEDSVILTLGTERYEIMPYSTKRVRVRRHYEKLDHVQEGPTPDARPLSTRVVTTGDPALDDSPSDRKLKEEANRLLKYNRTTPNPAFLKAVEIARQAPREITYTLPHGHTIGWRDKRRIEKMLRLLTRGDLEGALKHIGKIHTRPTSSIPSTDPTKNGNVIVRYESSSYFL